MASPRRTAPPPGRWKGGFCDCCRGDPSLCCVVTCCAPTTAAQMHERVVRPNTCLLFASLLWGGMLLSEATSLVLPVDATSFLILSLLASLASAASLLQCCLVYSTRRRLRKRDNIAGPAIADGIVSLCCGCCAQIQHLKQEGVESETYSLTAADGSV